MASKGLKPNIPQIKTDEFCENISDNIISVTESKAKLIYNKYMEAPTKEAIFTDLGLTVAFLVPVITSDFKRSFGLSPEVLQAIFIVVSAIFGVKLIKSTALYFMNGRLADEKHFLKELKGQVEEK